MLDLGKLMERKNGPNHESVSSIHLCRWYDISGHPWKTRPKHYHFLFIRSSERRQISIWKPIICHLCIIFWKCFIQQKVRYFNKNYGTCHLTCLMRLQIALIGVITYHEYQVFSQIKSSSSNICSDFTFTLLSNILRKH